MRSFGQELVRRGKDLCVVIDVDGFMGGFVMAWICALSLAAPYAAFAFLRRVTAE